MSTYDLPPEILNEILKFNTTWEVLNFRACCKYWDYCITAESCGYIKFNNLTTIYYINNIDNFPKWVYPKLEYIHINKYSIKENDILLFIQSCFNLKKICLCQGFY